MICAICQAVLTRVGRDDSAPDVKGLLHHLTACSFKRSVELGCYVCNALWSARKPVEQALVSCTVDSRPDPTSNGAGDCLDESPRGSVDEFRSEFWLYDDSAHGRPGCFILESGVDAPRVAAPGTTGEALPAKQPSCFSLATVCSLLKHYKLQDIDSHFSGFTLQFNLLE